MTAPQHRSRNTDDRVRAARKSALQRADHKDAFDRRPSDRNAFLDDDVAIQLREGV